MKYKAIKINGKKYAIHRVVMEKHIGRKLTSKEAVHHRDGNVENNAIENLKLMSLSEHSHMHMKGKRPKITTEQLRKNGRRIRPAAKLRIEDIADIRLMLRDGIEQWLIAWIYRVNMSAISKIKRGVHWEWVT